MDIEQTLMSGKISRVVDREGVSSDKERPLLSEQEEAVEFADFQSSGRGSGFMSVVEPTVRQPEEGLQKTFISVASVSVTNVYETDPDDSADNLKPSSGFSGDDEASAGEEELKPLLGDIEVRAQVHHDSGEEERERLNVSRNSDYSGDNNRSKSPPVGHWENENSSDQNPPPATYSTRIPWTTRLIQKLTEEENKKKLRTEESLKQARKTRVPLKRSAIYERTDKSSPWLIRPGKVIDKNNPPVPNRVENQGTRDKTGSPQETSKTAEVGDGGEKVGSSESNSKTKSESNESDPLIPKASKDRFAEIISKLVIEEEDKLTDISDESEVKTTPEHTQTYFRSESVLSYADRIDELPSLRSSAGCRPSPPNSEPKHSPHSVTNTKRSPHSDSSNEASPSRRPYIETAFLSNSPPRNRDTEEDLMFRKIEAKFSSSLRQKSTEESKPKISPKPDTKSSLPIFKRVAGSPAKKSDPRNGNEDLSPIYANEVFFRKKRQQVPADKVEEEPKVNGRGIGYRVSPRNKEAEHLPRGKPVALAQINTSSVEYLKATQFEGNHNNAQSQRDEQDFAQQTNSKFNEYVKEYKDFYPNDRSSSSSTSTIVSEAPWSPDTVDLETAAISGSPEIRKLQMKQREYEILQNGNFNDRNSAGRTVYYSEEQRLRSQLPLKIQTDSFTVEEQYHGGRSGRLSAPPEPYYEYSRKLYTPEPVKTAAPLHSSPKQAARVVQETPHPVPQQRKLFNTPSPKSQKYYSLDSESPTARGHLLIPVSAKVKITAPSNDVQRGGPITGPDSYRVSPQQKQSPATRETAAKGSPQSSQSRQEEIYYERYQSKQTQPRQSPNPAGGPQKITQKQQEEIYLERLQKTRSLPTQHARYPPTKPNEYLNRSFSPSGNYRKLSRPEVEQLYWQAQLMREMYAAQLSPQAAQLFMSQFPSTGSLQSTSSLPSPRPQLARNVPLVKGQPMLVTNLNTGSSVPNVNRGSPQLLYYKDPRDGLLKPQAMYDNRQVYVQSMQEGRLRSRSVSPGPNNKYYLNQPQSNFIRGSPQRNTIGAIRVSGSQPQQTLQATTIYENTTGVFGSQVQLRHPEKVSSTASKIPNGNVRSEKVKQDSSKKTKEEKKKDKKSKDKEKEKEKIEQYYPPIFKRGSLSLSTSSVDENESPTVPKRVSFSSACEESYWPTRKGLAPQPPTRQHKQRPDSGDSDVFLPSSPGHYYRYTNVGPPDRPLPPVPSPYGSINKTRYSDFERPAVQAVRGVAAAAPPFNQVPATANRWQPISESESGSEAGEIQRIFQQGNGNVTYFRFPEEEWGADGKPRGPPGSDQSGSSGGGRDDEVRRSVGARGSRRDEPRRHTLSGDHHHQSGSLARSMDLEMSSKQRRKSPLPRGYPPPSSAMLFDDDPGIMSEVETSSTGFRRGGKQRSSLPVVRTPSKTLERPLGKAMMGHQQQMQHPHSSGGLVFLQYRNETKRALLPNEITSLDTVRALFVRSFPKQLTMEYLDSHHVKIYIHDSSKDMFYELEDLRSHLRDIRDRSVLRLFESADVNGGVLPGAGVGVAPPIWDQDQSYFSEPEFDSEYQHQHIHKSKTSSKSSGAQPYYMTHSYPPGGAGSSATLPRGGSLLRTYSPAVPPPLPADRIKTLPQTGVGPPPKPVRTYHQAQGLVARGNQPIYGSFVNCADRRDQSSIYASPDRLHAESGYMSSPERGGPRGSYPPGYLPSGGPSSYEDPYYSQYAPRSGSITPVIDEEASDTELLDESYSLYGVKLPSGRPVVVPPSRGPFPAPTVVPYDQTRASLSRIRVEHMERQLANLTGLVQKALTHTPTPREYLQVPVQSSRDANNYRNAADDYDKHSSSSSASLPDEAYLRTDTKPPKLGKDKSVSFEKSVSFSDEPPDMNSPKQHSPQHAERNDRDRHKPAPPPKPVSLSPAQYEGRHIYRDLQMTPELYNQLRGLQKKAKDLRTEVRNLRRMSQAQAHSVRETIRDTFIKIRAVLVAGGADVWSSSGDHDKLRLTREEDLYKQEMLRLETDLTELESTVEELRGNVINRKTRVNMSDVENMALILSKSSKTVADLKVRFPGLQDGMKSLITSEMEKVEREEKFLNEEPERLESALRRCKKLTGTLVTLKRLASVQEQRLPPSSTPESRLSPTMGDSDSTPPITPPAHGKAGAVSTRGVMATTLSTDSLSRQRPENALDALLDELQTFARPPSNPSLADIGRKGSVDSQHPPATGGTLRRLHSYPSSSDGGGSSPPTLSRLQAPKPPVPERNAELLAQLAGRRQPPPPPPRTSSRSPLASPTSPSLPPRGSTGQPQMGVSGTLRRGAPGRSSLREPLRTGSLSEARPTEEMNPGFNPLSASNSSSCESVNSQEGLQPKSGKQRQEVLEQRHQELLRKQKALQEQYARLQQLQRGAGSLSVPQPDLLLKKTGSESNLLAKMGLGHNLSAAAPISGSLTHLAVAPSQPITSLPPLAKMKLQTAPTSTTTTNKIYETDIL